jgi:hypothetical protein
MLRLPDLPNAGYATHREKALSDAVMQFLRDTERQRLRLLTIVLAGRTRWRQVAQSVWRGVRIGEDHQLLDAIYDYFTLQACPPTVQVELLKAQKNPAKWKELANGAMPTIEKEREQLRLMAKWSV